MNDLLPPITGEESKTTPDELMTEEMQSLLAGLPADSASTDSPQELIVSSATPPSTSSTQSGELISWTLSRLDREPPPTTCARCRAAIWQLEEKGELKVYCRLMYRFMEENLQSCDGQQMAAEILQQ